MNFDLIYQNIFHTTVNNNNTENIENIEENNTMNKQPIKNVSKKKTEKDQEVSKSALELTPETYFKNNVNLSKYKLFELKYIAKKSGLRFSGTKKVLMERIEEYFIKTKHIIKIQSIMRRWIVLCSIKNRGPALFNRSLCTNDSDFVTLEPLSEIPHESFFSYKDTKGFVYGFNISSLIETLKMKNSINNPYNRELLDFNTTKKIIQIYNICFLIYPDFHKENIRLSNNSIIQYLRNVNLLSNGEQPITNNNIFVNNTRNIWQNRNNNRENRENRSQMENITYYSAFVPNIQLNNYQEQRLRRLNEIRNLSISQRIHNLFIEIDSLGNYTNANWFSNLTRNDYILFYRTLYDIWYFQGNLHRSLRYNICPFQTPFVDMHIFNRNNTDLSTDIIQNYCLIAFENLTYTGIDDEHRRLGVLHSLSALTIVSVGARASLPWLYDSIAF